MSGAGARWGWWAAALFWMAVIFCASLAYLSGEHTGHFLDWLAHRLHWTLSYAARHEINLAVRKLGHVAEYAILAALLYAALRRTIPGSVSWRNGVAALAFGLAVLYAAGDEYHQSFVPGRTSAAHDVGLDAVGAALGLALARWRRRNRSEE